MPSASTVNYQDVEFTSPTRMYPTCYSPHLSSKYKTHLITSWATIISEAHTKAPMITLNPSRKNLHLLLLLQESCLWSLLLRTILPHMSFHTAVDPSPLHILYQSLQRLSLYLHLQHSIQTQNLVMKHSRRTLQNPYLQAPYIKYTMRYLILHPYLHRQHHTPVRTERNLNQITYTWSSDVEASATRSTSARQTM